MPNEQLKVIAIMTRKGGAGKTALARALMSAIIADGKRCIAIDADPQQALFRWWESVTTENPDVASTAPELRVLGIDSPSDLEAIIDDAYENDAADFVIIDTMGAGGQWADELAVHSDHIVLPMMLSDTDMRIATDTYNWYQGLFERAEDPSVLPKLTVVLSRVDKNPSNAMRAMAREANAKFPVIEELFMDRKQHADVDREGLFHQISKWRTEDPNPLMRTHARLYDEALDEAREILSLVLEAE
ncbi:ParA family protein [Primorskyibacter sp. S187A]|uniref:ParA family protein n=1 Tax=Primorskyibacter sp. S187A TaxID=3415130 RepID=UPI003C7BC844